MHATKGAEGVNERTKYEIYTIYLPVVPFLVFAATTKRSANAPVLVLRTSKLQYGSRLADKSRPAAAATATGRANTSSCREDRMM